MDARIESGHDEGGMGLISLKLEVGERFSSRLHSGVPIATVAANTERTGGTMADEDGAVEWKKPEWWHDARFKEFEDWLIDGPAGEWPRFYESRDLSPLQRKLVSENAALLTAADGGKGWSARVQAFESAIGSLAEVNRKTARAAFRIHFDRHVFSASERNFFSYRFPCSVSFVGAKFGDGDVNFSGAEFGDGDVRFDRTTFGNGEVLFSDAKFSDGDVWFAGANFGDGDVSFSGATFGAGVISFEASFGKGEVSLFQTRFGDGFVIFPNPTMTETDFEADCMVVEGSLFVRAHFPKSAKFRQLTVGGNADFSGSTFAQIPDFTDAKFDRPPEVAGMVVPAPKLSKLQKQVGVARFTSVLFELAQDPDDVLKLRKLKAMALSVHDHEKDGDFFAAEMLAKRGTETTSFWGLAFNTLYWKLSNFGQSFTQPLRWLARSFLLFAALNVLVVSIGNPNSLTTIASRSLAVVFSAFLSLKNSIPLLGSLFRFAPAPEGHVSWFQGYYDTLEAYPATVDWLIGLGVVQNIFGGVLLFLFLLALRNRFRLK